jgi:hypothetical protein
MENNTAETLRDYFCSLPKEFVLIDTRLLYRVDVTTAKRVVALACVGV